MIKTVNLKVLFFIVTSNTILIKYKIIDSKNKTTKITISNILCL